MKMINANPNAVSLADIETTTRDFSQAHDALMEEITALKDQLDAVKAKAMPKLKMAVRKAADLKAQLSTQIEAAPGLFVKPRTYQFHGVKVGLGKNPGGLDIPDPDRTLDLIERNFPDRVEELIRTKRTPNRETIGELLASDLKRIGVEISDASDRVIVAPVTSEIDKAIKALLKDATDEALEQAA